MSVTLLLTMRALALFLASASSGLAFADTVTTTPLHVGGFLDGGLAENGIEHQNYFVGYGTVGGFRSSERRSFFWYHVPSFEGEVIDVSIKLKMPFSTSMIFGLDPTDPTKHDAKETFRLGATPVDPLTMVDPDLTTSEAQTIFDGMDDFAIAPDYDFFHGASYEFPLVTEIHLSDFGKGVIGSSRGKDLVLTGWMPTWSFDSRTDTSGKFLEADELLFGLSDIPAGVPPPELTIVYAVPEPTTWAVVGASYLLIKRRRSHRA